MKYLIYLLLSILIIISFACEEDNPVPSQNNLQIVKLIPDTVEVNTILSITGIGFGATQGSSFVSFRQSGTSDFVLWSNFSWSDTLIKVLVPNGVNTGKIYIVVNGEKSNGIDLIIKSPTIKEVKICNQIWMMSNLEVEFYRNGDKIPEVKDYEEWSKLTTGAWCYYNNDSSNNFYYGKIYNWYAVNDTRGLAPKGWHIASDDEWKILIECLGGETVAGGKLKTPCTIENGGLWEAPNEGATNESRFFANPGGTRSDGGEFEYIGFYGGWWTKTEFDKFTSFIRLLSSEDAEIFYDASPKGMGFSVRCVKDK